MSNKKKNEEKVLEVRNVTISYKIGDFRDIGLKEWIMRHLTHNYHVEAFQAVHDVSFDLYKGEMLGIVGSNGAGKSTLLKAVSGIMEPSEGQIERNGSVAALLELASGFDGDLTVKENAYLRGAMLGYTRQFMDEMYEQIIDFAELREFENRPFKQLSSGMQSRLAFSIASLVMPDILILDEVLSVGDGAFQEKSARKMREIISSGAATILVSHSLQQVRKLCTKVLWLDHGNVRMYGRTQTVCDAYERFLHAAEVQKTGMEPWRNVLYTPTIVQKLSNYYFVVDCWHHRILFSECLKKKIVDWVELTDSIYDCHSIDSDGELYVCEDAASDQVIVFRHDKDGFIQTQTVPFPGKGPHYTKFDAETNAFYTNSAFDGLIVKMMNRNGKLMIADCHEIVDFKGWYFRSFNIIDGFMYLISGPGAIYKVDYKSGNYDILEVFKLPPKIWGMNYIEKIGNYFYISVYQNSAGEIVPDFIRAKSLADLKCEKYESIYDLFGFHGTPYYISQADGLWYITEIDQASGIKSFEVENDNIKNIQTICYFEEVLPESIERKNNH